MYTRSRRIGLSKKDHQTQGYQPLHPGARDNRATNSSSLTNEKHPQAEEVDVYAPPQDSDDSDAAQRFDTSENEDDLISGIKLPPSSVPSTDTLQDDESGDSGLFPTLKKQTYVRPKKMSRKNPKQIARPPQKRHVQPPKPRMKQTTDSQGFQHVDLPARTSQEHNDNGFTHIPALKPPLSDSGSDGGGFVPPPRGLDADTSHIKGPCLADAVIGSAVTQLNGPKPRLSIHDDLDEYLNKENRKKRTIKDSSAQITTEPSSPKKRKTTPEAVFFTPPMALATDCPGDAPSELGTTPRGLQDSDNKTLLSPASLRDVKLSGSTLVDHQSNGCTMCLAPIDPEVLDAFRIEKKLSPESRLTVRQQELLHLKHSRLDAEALWQERRYPKIDWMEVPGRLNNNKAHIMSIIEGYLPSYYRSKLKERLPSRGRKTATLAEEMKTGETAAKVLGYYGTRGQRITGDWLLSECSSRLKTKLKEPDFQLAGGVGGFVQKVLIPEAIQLLISEDMDSNPSLSEGAVSRADAIIRDTMNEEPQELATQKDLRESVRNAATEASIHASVSELDEESRRTWLARYLAMESASCGMLLSEEIEDVVPVNVSE